MGSCNTFNLYSALSCDVKSSGKNVVCVAEKTVLEKYNAKSKWSVFVSVLTSSHHLLRNQVARKEGTRSHAPHHTPTRATENLFLKGKVRD